jgi:hypothetical protein
MVCFSVKPVKSDRENSHKFKSTKVKYVVVFTVADIFGKMPKSSHWQK